MFDGKACSRLNVAIAHGQAQCPEISSLTKEDTRKRRRRRTTTDFFQKLILYLQLYLKFKKKKKNFQAKYVHLIYIYTFNNLP